jgi:serine/threonine protein kinase
MAELKLQQCRLDGRYDVLECLGRGSYAEIYKAHDNAAPEDGPETVVIKALNLLLQDEPDQELERTLVSNFQNEAVALDRVRHPNIISRLGHGTAIDLNGTTFHYILLEYLSGGDMAAHTRNRPLSLERALFYLEQVCSGLAHAHKCGVIHRDIKPQNLLLTGDEQTLKIADFGVARLEANEGAITRVGTSIYSAPEHNPLMQTAQLDSSSLSNGRPQLTPAADIYSLAKTVYTLLAGEAPRRFAQRTITELPPFLSDKYWSVALLSVLERATQPRAEDRYQTVPDFWVELADAALPKTRELPGAFTVDAPIRVSAELRFEPEELTRAPPRPRFEVPRQNEPAFSGASSVPRPKIVVPVNRMAQATIGNQHPNKTASEIIAAFPNQVGQANRRQLDQRSNGGRAAHVARPPASRGKRFLVAAGLVLAFSCMLLATHRYVTSHWNPLVNVPGLSNTFIVGREGVTTTDLNLRADPSADNPAIGLAETGSRVRVLKVDGNSSWYEVKVLQHGRPKQDQFLADQGWVNKRYLKLD